MKYEGLVIFNFWKQKLNLTFVFSIFVLLSWKRKCWSNFRQVWPKLTISCPKFVFILFVCCLFFMQVISYNIPCYSHIMSCLFSYGSMHCRYFYLKMWRYVTKLWQYYGQLIFKSTWSLIQLGIKIYYLDSFLQKVI